MATDKPSEVVSVNNVLTRAGILANRADMRPATPVDVPEWGGTVLVRPMSGTERDAYEGDIVGNKLGKDRRANLQNLRAKLVARCIVDNDGKALFDYRNPADIGALGALDAAGLDRVFKACQRVNGITDEDVNDLSGNSETAANANSGTN